VCEAPKRDALLLLLFFFNQSINSFPYLPIDTWKASELSDKLEIGVDVLKRRIAFWIGKGVLEEGPGGVYRAAKVLLKKNLAGKGNVAPQFSLSCDSSLSQSTFPL